MIKNFTVLLLLSLASNPIMAQSPYDKLSLQYTGGTYENETFHYRLMAPKTIEPGRKYPLVLFLHGAGERGDDNEAQLKYLPTEMAEAGHRDSFPCFVLAPQCRKDQKWVDVDWSKHETTDQPEEPSDQMKTAMAMLQKTIDENPIDETRIYLTGLSMGGYGSWDLASRHPEWFAGAIIVCGGGDEKQAAKLTKLPIWVFHGDADKAVPVERSRKMVKALQAAGGELIKYSELPGVEHNSWSYAYSDEAGAIKWLFEQKRADAKK